MKTNLILLAAVLVALLPACNKEKASPEEQAISSFLADSTTRIGRGRYTNIEMGYRFYASRPGRITKVGTRLPEAGTYTVSLWDSDTQILLAQETVEQTAADVLTLDNITPLAVVPNKKYVISVNYGAETKAAHVIGSKGATTLLPFTKGSITVVNAQFINTRASVFPLLNYNVVIYGYPELAFVAD